MSTSDRSPAFIAGSLLVFLAARIAITEDRKTRAYLRGRQKDIKEAKKRAEDYMGGYDGISFLDNFNAYYEGHKWREHLVLILKDAEANGDLYTVRTHGHPGHSMIPSSKRLFLDNSRFKFFEDYMLNNYEVLDADKPRTVKLKKVPVTEASKDFLKVLDSEIMTFQYIG